MKILWFTWKDKKNPLAGGAESVNENLAKRLVEHGHQVMIVTAGFAGSKCEEIVDGYKIVRVGNRFSVYWRAHKYYKKNLNGWADLVIDEINTIPFFAKYYVNEKNILFIHQLCRQIWFYEMFFPASLIGYWLEPFYLRLLRDKVVVTVSESSKNDLIKFGFKPKNIFIISEGIENAFSSIAEDANKFTHPTMLALGSIRPMKRTGHIIRAFEIARQNIPDLQLIIAGSPEGRYGKKIVWTIQNNRYRNYIDYRGRVSRDEKMELMRKSQVICAASVKEGWGLIVAEANSAGTPAVVYDVDGLRDAVKDHETGLVCHANTPEDMAAHVVSLLKNHDEYDRLRQNARQWSKTINFERSYNDFINVINNL
ncbi:MAG: glycosyltransferase family 4 protein [Patescibacteria group bacterium]